MAASGTTIEIAVNDSGGTDPPTILQAPSGGTAVVSGSGFLYTADPGFAGTDSFIYQICAPDDEHYVRRGGPPPDRGRAH